MIPWKYSHSCAVNFQQTRADPQACNALVMQLSDFLFNFLCVALPHLTTERGISRSDKIITSGARGPGGRLEISSAL